ncbi:MAG: extracellular solute-binding protein [Candidatus Pacebacteria bacterium]|nr:extracellular solute-binding protein [Candidatus Paceibacterota bacterium]
MSKKKIVLLIFVIILISAAIYFFASNYDKPEGESKKESPIEVTLEFWGLWDNTDDWQPIIDRFENEIHDWNGQEVKVTINYTKKNYSSYEKELREAYDNNQSPSVFMLSNYWLKRYQDEIEPLSRNEAYIKEYGLINSEEITDIFPANILPELIVDDLYLYALPTYSDSLVLYYNKDMFKEAGIDTPPATWEDLKKNIKRLTILGRNDEVKQSAIALGGGTKINRSCDILAALMLQGGARIIDEDGNIDFNREIGVNTTEGTQQRNPGPLAIQFFMEFSDPKKEIYTWNSTDTKSSLEDFASQRTAMMINFGYQQKNLLALNSGLNYGIAPLPQLENSTEINIYNVWLPTVSNQNSCSVKNSDNSKIDCTKIAWSFLSFTNQKENISYYLESTGKAAARKDLIEEQKQMGSAISVFAAQTETTTYYNKFDDKIEGIFVNMLDDIDDDRENWEEKMNNAAIEIENLKN